MTKVAVGQLCSTANIQNNLTQCVKLVREASAGGAKVLFLPEASDYIATSAQESLSLAQPQETSPFVLGLRDAAREHGIDVHVGIHVPVPGDGSKLLNRTIWIRADGSIYHAATYDKLHLFDYGDLRESATVKAGERLTEPFETVVGRVGSLICFDLRFVEVAIALTRERGRREGSGEAEGGDGVKGPAQILTYPSAFTVRTGRAHWEVLLRARAIETQSWVVAAAQCGQHNEKRTSWGNSMVVDPWGRVVLAMGHAAGEQEEEEVGEVQNVVGFVDLDMGLWEETRKGMPLLRRTDVYPKI